MANKTTVSEEQELAKLNSEFEVKPEVTMQSTMTAIEAKANQEMISLETRRKMLVGTYRSEPKVPVTVSPFYAPYLSKIVRASVNGIMVEVPANGQTYMINQTHADHINAKIQRINAMVARQKRAGSVSQNFERAPGELHI